MSFRSTRSKVAGNHELKMAFCPDCGEKTDIIWKHPECGYEETMLNARSLKYPCRVCGGYVSSHDKFCRYCGLEH